MNGILLNIDWIVIEKILYRNKFLATQNLCFCGHNFGQEKDTPLERGQPRDSRLHVHCITEFVLLLKNCLKQYLVDKRLEQDIVLRQFVRNRCNCINSVDSSRHN